MGGARGGARGGAIGRTARAVAIVAPSAWGGAQLCWSHQFGTGPDGTRHARVLRWIGHLRAEALGRMPDPARVVEEGACQGNEIGLASAQHGRGMPRAACE